MGKNKYGFEKNFTRLLNGPFPFFVIRFHSPLYKIERENAIRKVLAEAAGDGFIDIRSYYFLLKISRLIEKKLIPQDAMFIDKYFDEFHCFIFCKHCIQPIKEIFKVLEKEALGNFRWKLIAYVKGYKEIDLMIPRFLSRIEIECPLPGHPSHDSSPSSAGQLGEEKKDLDQGVLSLLAADEHAGEEESEQAGVHEILLHRVHVTERDFELDWEPIEEALQKLYICNPEEVFNVFNISYIKELQQHVAEMTRCHSDSQERIHKQLEQTFISHLIDICLSTSGYEGITFLQEVYKNWLIFFPKAMRTLLLFESVGPSCETPLDLGLSLWAKYIIAPGKLITTMVSHLRSERDIQHDIMSELIGMLMIYPSALQSFEMEFVGASEVIYETNSDKIRSRCSYSIITRLRTVKACHKWKEYFQYLDEYLSDELKLAKSYLGAKCQLLLLEAFHNHHFTKYNEWLKLCLKQSIDDDDYSLVFQMHSLLSRLPSGPAQMKDLLVSHVEESFTLVRDGPHDDVVNGQHLLLLRHKYDLLVNESLSNDKSLEQAVNITFRKIANSSNECARCMTAYIDSRLRQPVTMKIEQEIKDAFQFVVKYVGADAFRIFYWHYMADRLTKMASSHREERQLIEMLKIQYGTAFTDNLEQMLHEIESQHQILEGFNSNFPNECPRTSFMLLNSRCWPVKQMEPLDLPLDVRPMIERFEAHYLDSGAHRKKRIWWQAHLGSATLVLTSSNGQRHELVVSTPQMSVLMLFSSADSLTYRQIQEATRMADANLQPCLRSLLSADGTSILTMDKNIENEFSENDILSFNEKFNGHLDLSRKHEIGPDKLVEIVDEAKKHHIEAAIVRIMKNEKSLDHTSLVTAVTKALEPLFITTPAAVKRRIENLIANGFLEREQDDRNCYKYV
ncbi:hypothetical protein QYE76_025795 [Lolium multiflorum]|uniref:Cullin family profile domain-containing protein n=1 Tax=Lolium multiflorum TaxID=4521 RepID=A0AAD8RJA7_LOLMU|nr:hypothetical protein QYE76_025795 [Lolium multiflorum]